MSELKEKRQYILGVISRKQTEIFELRKLLKSIEEEIVKEDHGIKIGSVVASNGEKYTIAEIKYFEKHKPYLKGYKHKKNGEPGKSLQHVYGKYEVCE